LPDALGPDDERRLLADAAALPLSAVVMRGFTAKRRTAHFGAVYGYDSWRLDPGPPIPDFLLELREAIACLAGLDAAGFTEALVTEYLPGATIGWHRDAPMFGPVVLGVSIGSACRMRFRRGEGEVMERSSIVLEPRSAYVLEGPARSEWQHSIPALAALRYSITFRSVRARRTKSNRGVE
jgi:alkylated DNA repair dioxygenase AlkB